MTIPEFSSKFDVLLNSYNFSPEFGDTNPKFNPALNEYEKSVFLTEAEKDIFLSLYTGKDITEGGFEVTEENRRYLDNLIETKPYTPEKASNDSIVSPNSVIVHLDPNVAFITLEQVTYDSTDDCLFDFRAKVYPVTQDEYARVKDNPFRGPTKYKVLRLDIDQNTVELIPAKGFKIKEYLVRYLRKPNPIILTDLRGTGLTIDKKDTPTECEMDPMLHDFILRRAVALAVQSKSLGMPSTNNKNE